MRWEQTRETQAKGAAALDQSRSDSPGIIVSHGQRRSQVEQLTAMLSQAHELQRPVRIRLPFTYYDHTTRGYTQVRDAAWNLQLPVEQTTPETIAQLIAVLGQCIVAIAQHGSAEVEGALRTLVDQQGVQGVQDV